MSKIEFVKFNPSPEDIEKDEKLFTLHEELWNIIRKYIEPCEVSADTFSGKEIDHWDFNGEPEDMVIELVDYTANKIGITT